MPEDLNNAASQVLPRVGQPFPKNMGENIPWHRSLGDSGLIANMVIDHPHFMAYVAAPLVEKSGRTGDQWLEDAKKNLLQQTPADYLSRITDEVDIRIGCCGDAYDAARALIVDEMLPDDSEFGFFVAVPARDVVVVMPVTPATLVHVHVLRRFAEDNFASKPYPISNEVFWVRRGEWFRFPIAITKESVQVTPPDEFVDEVLKRFPDEPGDAETPPG